MYTNNNSWNQYIPSSNQYYGQNVNTGMNNMNMPPQMFGGPMVMTPNGIVPYVQNEDKHIKETAILCTLGVVGGVALGICIGKSMRRNDSEDAINSFV